MDNNKLGLVGVVVIGLYVVGVAITSNDPKPSKSPAQIAEEARQAELAEDRRKVALGVGAVIAKQARDPASIKFESTTVSADAKIVCAEYRGLNGFGGMTKEFTVFVNDRPFNDEATWNKNCLKEMYEYTKESNFAVSRVAP